MRIIFKILSTTVILFVIILIITNPTIKQLKEYTGEYSNECYIITYTRNSNYILFSKFNISYIKNCKGFYQRNIQLESKLNSIVGDYYGFLSNFYK